MAEDADSTRLLVVGANHRSSSVTTRERLFVEETDVPAVLQRLRDGGLGQAMLLATCDRVEVQAAVSDLEATADTILGEFADRSGMARAELAAETYRYEGRQAARHIFMVAASLDSLIIGEPQILGQVKESHRLARAAGLSGADLDAVLEAAYGTAKRVRSQTAIGERPVSIAAAAERLARGVHGGLERRSALLLAGGDMGEMIAEQLRAGGLGELTIAARTEARAEVLARRHGCHHAPLDALDRLIAQADIVISAVASGRHMISADLVARALAERRQKPIFLIDAAVPGDVEPAVDRLDGAFLYDLGDLEAVAMAGRSGRDAAAATAEAIIEQDLEAYFGNRAQRRAAPLVTALRAHFEDQRRQVLAQDGGADAEEATRLLVNRMLHAPSVVLRELAAQGGALDGEALLRRLFALDAKGDAAENDDPKEDEQ